MTTPKLQRLGKIARSLFIASVLWAIPSFWFSVELNVGRHYSSGLSLVSRVASVAINVITFTNPPTVRPWYINTSVDRIEYYRAPPAAPVPGWEDHGNEFFGYSDLTRGGVLVCREYHLVFLGAQLFFALVTGFGWLLAAKTLRLRRIRATTQCCTKCGYDLHASPERCPECGTKTVPAFTWFEPKWSFAARCVSPAGRARFKKSLWALSLALGGVCIIVCVTAWWAPEDHPPAPKLLVLLILDLVCALTLSFFIVGSLRWRYPPIIAVDETGIKFGPDQANPAPEIIFPKHVYWNRIHSAQITHDEQGRAFLELTIRPIVKSSLHDYHVTRAIAPEINLQQLQLRLAAWTTLNPPSAPFGPPAQPDKPSAPENS